MAFQLTISIAIDSGNAWSATQWWVLPGIVRRILSVHNWSPHLARGLGSRMKRGRRWGELGLNPVLPERTAQLGEGLIDTATSVGTMPARQSRPAIMAESCWSMETE